MTEWSQCVHKATGRLVAVGCQRLPGLITFGSDHSTLHTWKFQIEWGADGATLSLHSLPLVSIHLIDVIFTVTKPNESRQYKNFRVGIWSVGRDWVVVSKINGIPSYPDLFSSSGGINVDVEIAYYVPKSSGLRWVECDCAAAPPSARDHTQPAIPSPLQPTQPLVTLSEDLRKMFLSRAFADFVFDVGGVEIPAHKNILSSRLTYFERLFASGKRKC